MKFTQMKTSVRRFSPNFHLAKRHTTRALVAWSVPQSTSATSSIGVSITITHHFLSLLAAKSLLLRCYTQNIDSLESAAGLRGERIGSY